MQIGKDKLLHALVCFALEIMFASMGVWSPMWRFVFVAGIIGGSKELYDATHEGHDADWFDLLADAIGALAGEVVVLILHG